MQKHRIVRLDQADINGNRDFASVGEAAGYVDGAVVSSRFRNPSDIVFKDGDNSIIFVVDTVCTPQLSATIVRVRQLLHKMTTLFALFRATM
mgnify:CR=1 FL=1|jgi:hypothetical protein